MPRSRNEQLTDRQHQVLRLIAAGKTNAEIASSLGITIDGAKYHVGEIVSKLGAESREDAVARWRAEQTPAARTRRILTPLIAGAGWLKVGAGIVAVGIAAIAVVLALRDDSSKGEQGFSTNAADALKDAQSALDRANRYTLTLEQSNFVLGDGVAPTVAAFRFPIEERRLKPFSRGQVSPGRRTRSSS